LRPQGRAGYNCVSSTAAAHRAPAADEIAMSWRRILLLTAGLFAVLLVATWFVLQRTGAVTGIVRSLLEHRLVAPFRLDRAQADLFGGSLTMYDLALADPTRPGTDLVSADSLQLGVETDPLGNVLAIHEVVVDGPRVDLDLTDDHVPTLPRLLRDTDAPGDLGVEAVTPARLSRGHARVRVDAELPVLEFSQVELVLQRVLGDDGGVDRRRGALRGSARCDNLAVDVDYEGDEGLVREDPAPVRVEGLALARGEDRHRDRLGLALLLEEDVEIVLANLPEHACPSRRRARLRSARACRARVGQPCGRVARSRSTARPRPR